MTATTTTARIDPQTQEELMRQAGIWIEHSTLIEDDLPARPLAAVQAEKHQLDRYTQLVADRAAARDSKCLAQIDEPAQPICWIRFCSDGSTEGPIMHSQICEARKTSGAWTPLYAGAAPAAVSPQGEYPQLPEAAVWSVAGEDGMPTLGKGWMFSPVQQSNATLPLFTARQMWAYHDLGRQSAPAAPALEAPAAPTQDMESEQCRCEPSDWSPPAGYDGDGSVAAMPTPRWQQRPRHLPSARCYPKV